MLLWDERLSTSAVLQRMADSHGKLKSGRVRSLRDKLAAAYILQDFLDLRRTASKNEKSRLMVP